MNKNITMKGRTLTAAHWVDAGYTVDGIAATHIPAIEITPRQCFNHPRDAPTFPPFMNETCACTDCNKKSVKHWGGRPHCADCLPPMVKPAFKMRIKP